MDWCPSCDTLLTRVARLVMRLEKISVEAHRDLGHPAASWKACELEPCLSNNLAVHKDGYARSSEAIRRRA